MQCPRSVCSSPEPGAGCLENGEVLEDLELGRDRSGIIFLKDVAICTGEKGWIGLEKCGSGRLGGDYWQEMMVT